MKRTPLALRVLPDYTLGEEITNMVTHIVGGALGITLNAVDLKKYDRFSQACYLLMGWCIIFRIGTVRRAIGESGFALLLAGGIAYTVGAVLYALGRRHRYAHSAFHVFVVIGSLLHFLCILLYVL